jgi:site-specific recombinase XerD
MTPIAPFVVSYLREHLPIERRFSQNTCDTYAYSLQLLFEYASKRLGETPSKLNLEQIDSLVILGFLEHLQNIRGNSPTTRNARLVAIKSFMRFVEYRSPSSLEQVRQILAIPPQKTDDPLIRHLDVDEVKALLDAVDPSTRLGIRDRAMLHLAITGGLRVSELVALRLDEIIFRSRYVDIRIIGKGRRERSLTLWNSVAQSLRAWITLRGDARVLELFLNARGQPMTRSGFEYILLKHVDAARTRCPSLSGKRVSPHVLRHTCAMNILKATGDIRKVALWLGHASTQTTEIYLRADPTERLEALDKAIPPCLRPGTFSPPDRLIELLKEH